MKIPKIIHQTWKTEDLPPAFAQMAECWKAMHPDWQYMLWTDVRNRQFIEEHFPSFLSVYNSYEANIQRVDAVRYFTLYQMGGVYIDLDIECIRNIEPILQDVECLFGKEPDEHCRIHQKEMIISNAFMAAVPRHPFFRRLCAELARPARPIDHPNNNILETTGPFMLSRVYENETSGKGLKLLGPEFLYPLTKTELEDYTGPAASGADISAKLAKAYAIHHYAGTWWKKTSYAT